MTDQETKHEWVSKPEECVACNYDNHTCYFCGTELDHESFEADGRRHWLSDCRPDLVEHEIGPLCTWPDDPRRNAYRSPGCYAYQDDKTRVWTNEHTHFYTDGPMV